MRINMTFKKQILSTDETSITKSSIPKDNDYVDATCDSR